MLTCIIATMRPNVRTKRPSTPASFMRRSTRSGSLGEVRISRNSRLASGSWRRGSSVRERERAAVPEPRARDPGEIAHLLGDQKIMLHEPLDVLQPGMARVAEPHRDLALDVERQALLAAPGENMHVAADRPEEVLAAADAPELVAVEHVVLDQLFGLAHVIDVLGDPEQRVQVA